MPHSARSGIAARVIAIVVIAVVVVAGIGVAVLESSPKTSPVTSPVTVSTTTGSSQSTTQLSSTLHSSLTTLSSTSIEQQTIAFSPIEDQEQILQNSWFQYYLDDPSVPAPVGVATYGIENQSGALKGYTISTSQVYGNAKINSLGAYNASLPTEAWNNAYSNARYGANLQLNAFVQVNTTTGVQVLWVQNTNRFDTLNKEVNTPRDLVFNSTQSTSELAAASGKGSISDGTYSYGLSFEAYTLPLDLNLSIAVEVIHGTGVQVSFYNEPFGNGWFDQVLIPIKNVVSAAIVVTPYQTVGSDPYDVELVWTGFCCSYGTTYTSMNSFLSLYFLNSYANMQVYPSYYSFGSETAETAASLQVASTSTGGQVSLGTVSNGYL